MSHFSYSLKSDSKLCQTAKKKNLSLAVFRSTVQIVLYLIYVVISLKWKKNSLKLLRNFFSPIKASGKMFILPMREREKEINKACCFICGPIQLMDSVINITPFHLSIKKQ